MEQMQQVHVQIQKPQSMQPAVHKEEAEQKRQSESTIIDIPDIISTTRTTTIDNNNKLKSSSSLLSLYSSTSASTTIETKTPTPSTKGTATPVTSYDTDSSNSTVSSTCCTRHGEEIYMERGGGIGVVSSVDTDADDDIDAVHYKADHRKSWPIFILSISLIEIAIFVYDFMQMQPKTTATLPVAIPTDSVLIYRPDRRLEIWRFISYMFLHANLFHLGFNVVVQLFYGIPLEVMHGSSRIAIIYFAGVFAGSLGTSVVDSEVYLVGASGGVYALLAAHLANITLNYAQMKYAVAQLLSVLIFVTCDLGYALYTQFLYVEDDDGFNHVAQNSQHRLHHHIPTHSYNHINYNNHDKSNFLDVRSAPPVSYIAHLTGALAGLTIGLLVLKNFERRAYKNLIWWLALGIYSAFTVFAIVFNLINTMTAQLMEEQGEVITQHLLHDLGVS